MKTLTELIDGCTLKHQKKIERLVEPLMRISGITGFFHYTISTKGLFTFVGNQGRWMEEYYSQGYFLDNPFLKAPELLPKGIILNQQVKDEKYLDTLAIRRQKIEADHSMLLIEHGLDGVEAFGLFTTSANKNIYNFYYNERILLNSYIRYFKEEMRNELQEMKHNPANLKAAKKAAFTLPYCHVGGISDEERFIFLERLGRISPILKTARLSRREKQVASFAKRGHSASEIAQALYLSPRTVEFYLNNLKIKLCCYKKSELVNRLQELDNLLGL